MTTSPTTPTTTRPGRQSPASGAAITTALTRYSLLSFLREPLSLSLGLAYPIFTLLVMNAFLSGTGPLPGGVTFGQYLLPAMITYGTMATCLQTLAVSVAEERESGGTRRLAVLPTPPWAQVVSTCAVNTTLATINIVLLLIVGYAVIGIHPPTTLDGWGLMILTFLLTVGGCTALGLAIGRTQPSAKAAAGIVTPTLLVLQFISGLFFPLSMMPRWLVDVVSVLPVRWWAELMRECLLPPQFGAAEPTGSFETGKGLTISIIWLVVGIVGAIIMTRRDTVDR